MDDSMLGYTAPPIQIFWQTEDKWTDPAIANLVGQTFVITSPASPTGRAKVVAAERDHLRHGILITLTPEPAT